jgi:exopolysaccharide biosynthesis protein
MKKTFCKIMLVLICLILLPLQVAMASILGNLRSGSNADRTRMVVDFDKMPKYSETVVGKQLIITFDGKVKRNQSLQLKDPLVKSATLERFNNQSRLVVTFYKAVPQYSIFSLKNPSRLVVDFKKINYDKSVTKLAEGLTYTYLREYAGSLPEEFYILEIAPTSGYTLKPILGQGDSIQKGILSQMASNAGAKAAVNASYFDSDVWVIGNLMIDKKWVSAEDTPRTALIIDDNDRAQIIKNTSYSGKVIRSGGVSAKITGLNRMRLANDLIYYNDAYGTSTNTNAYGVEVRIERGRVTEVSKMGNLALRPNSVVLSGNGTAATFLQSLRVGARVKLQQSFGSIEADNAKHVLGVGPLLVDNGLPSVQSEAEEIADDIAVGRSPRTAVGIRADGTLVILVVDGRSSSSSGMSLAELAAYMVKLKVITAMNFDGGGSSEMVVNGCVVNEPSDGDERPIRVALGVFDK